MSDGRRPDVTLRDGALSVSAWCEEGSNGKAWWKTVQLQRAYESPKGSGTWKYGPIGGRDIPQVIQLLAALHAKISIRDAAEGRTDVGGQVDLNKYKTRSAEVDDADIPY